MLAWRTGSEDGNGNGNGDRPWNITQVANTNVSNLSKRKTGKDSSKLSGNTTASTYIMKNLSNFNQGFHDDGEGGSGQRLIGLIERLRLVNILVVVTRWYGGVPLGSTRFKCISDIAIENLKDIGVLDLKLSNKNWYINYENFINSKQMNK
ncbi:unnamed protein product [[Candida] boidinii]|nr:hypothetical protein B5S30_g3179 [[Candida] boidinii]OWB84775.1 hypothetical protein B5S33_g3428 [[Candida] boidinii]GMF05592.1 unnamed protein product [[Candida] boidinii]GMF54951.1 unnamed protein product [[Candida] boidinii]GMF82395.1 unnamed protein product [[Candida] boidinii]